MEVDDQTVGIWHKFFLVGSRVRILIITRLRLSGILFFDGESGEADDYMFAPRGKFFPVVSLLSHVRAVRRSFY